MRVSEVIELSALLLDIELTDDVRKDLVRCYNLVEQELATEYFPILEVEKFFHVEDKIYYKDFSRKPCMLKGIQDFHGDSVSFRLTPEYINLIKNYDGGTFFVKYYYIPEEKELYSHSTYGAEYISILKYGIAAEYCLIQGNFDLAAIYNQKYKERIKLKGPKKKKCE
jgi:hypothetical protein